jgi:hypothetical protein
LFLLQDEEDVGEVVLVVRGLGVVVRLEQEAVPGEEGVHFHGEEVRTHHGLHDSPDGARRLHGQTPGNKLLILFLLDDMVASRDVEELHGPDSEGAFAVDGLEEVVGGGAVVRRVERVDLLLVDDASGGHVHEAVGDQVPEIAVVGRGARGPPGDEGGEDQAVRTHLRRAAAEEGGEVAAELHGVRVQNL